MLLILSLSGADFLPTRLIERYVSFDARWHMAAPLLKQVFPQEPEQIVKRYWATGILAFTLILFSFSSTYIVEPGHRGVLITLGKVSTQFAPEGFGMKLPLVTNVVSVAVRQQTREVKAECFSSDLQQVNVEVAVLFKIPEKSVVDIYRNYAGDAFDSLIAPRVNEALKELTALQSAEGIVKKREEIKSKALGLVKQKVGDLLLVDDLVIKNITLSKELEHAIEAKMVQEQEASKAKFIQQKTEIEASTAVIKAKGEAQAMQIRGKALHENPQLVQLQIVEKWDGKTPMVVAGDKNGANILLPVSPTK